LPERERQHRSLTIGIALAIGAHVMWGVFPLYWRMLDSVPSVALTAHRIVWSFACLLLLSLIVPKIRRDAFRLPDRRTLVIHAVAAAMIAANWLAFLYAVATDRVLQASLGYYINPLVNVVLGVVFLGERLRPIRWSAVAVAAIGVTVMSTTGKGVPWIALTMASSFGVYGLMKKQAPRGAIAGLTLETGLLCPIALAYLLARASPIDAADVSPAIGALLVLGGLVTISPLVLFSVAAKRVPLSTLGILQFVGPTLQWIVGVVVFHEPIGAAQFWGFLFVWSGVVIFILSGSRAFRA